MSKFLVYRCRFCDDVEEREVGSLDKITFSIYQNLAICPKCKLIINGVLEESLKENKR